MVFRDLTEKDVALFNIIAESKGITLPSIQAVIRWDSGQLYTSLQKLKGSKQVSGPYRYLLVKKLSVGEGDAYFLTSKGLQFSSLFKAS